MPDPTPTPGPQPPSAVNAQIVDAVDKSTSYALGFAPLGPQTDPGTPVSAGAVIAYDKAVQAAALSVQDAADYQRNVLSLSAAVQGKAMAMLLAEPENVALLVPFAVALVSSMVAPISAGLAAGSRISPRVLQITARMASGSFPSSSFLMRS